MVKSELWSNEHETGSPGTKEVGTENSNLEVAVLKYAHKFPLV